MASMIVLGHSGDNLGEGGGRLYWIALHARIVPRGLD